MEMERPHDLCKLAEACIDSGQLQTALDALSEALTHIEEHETRMYEAEVHRLKGELLQQHDPDASEARQYFQSAIEIARRQGAKSYELRATTSLAQLLASQGRRDEARSRLAEIYGWFTEGFDTADLREASLLLEQLGA